MTTEVQETYTEVEVERTDDGVVYLTLAMPDRLNALTYQMIVEMRSVINDAARDIGVRCLVLRGAGRGFCAGDNLKGMGEAGPEVDQFGKYQTYGYTSVVKALRALPKPVVASVHGPALGAGLELALAADIRIVAREASLGIPFINLALAGGTYQLARIVGPTRAVELLFTGRRISGEEAGSYGIATEVVALEDLAASTAAWASKLAHLPTKAMGYMKRAIYRASEETLEEGIQEAALNSVLVQTLADRTEGKAAWLEKREPRFSGL
jgi:2-(1,2-epoxy-1,2-dihydrophenyl)acetyl-CoA isomerase